MDEESKPLTAFSVGNLGFYECERLSFGLCNAPATFQRLMEKCMGELHLRECLIFIDDILIFSKTFEEHIRRLEAVFARLEQHNLKLKPSKCEFFNTSVLYLGHIVSQEGIGTDPEKTEAVSKWKTPQDIASLRQFLGFAGYYRRFVKGYSSLAQPLHELLEGHCTHKPKKKKGKKSTVPAKWIWGNRQQKAFDSLKEKLTSPPVLAYADYSLPFIVHTDASGKGLGAILYQKQDGVEKVIAYASRGLRQGEHRYPAHKLEFLALKWAVTDKFHDYLMGHTFEVITDSNPLTYVLTSAKLDATGHRWVAALANYDFSIKYRSGKQNTDADALSRLFPDTVQAVCQAVTVEIPLVEAVSGSDTSHLASEEVLNFDNISKIDWQKEQLEDPVLARVIHLRRNHSRPRERSLREEPPPVQKFLREWNKFHFRDNVLYRTAALDGQPVEQLVVPSTFRTRAMKGIHDEAGHQGKEKTLWLARQRFYWPGLEKDIVAKVESCPRCIRRKTPVKPVAQLKPIDSTYPMELVCIDFLSLEKSKGGYEHILVITDHFTRYAQAIPCRNQKAPATAKALYEHFIRYYSFPARLHSDQGRNFESKVIRELCKVARTEKTRTTPYHPMGNGSAERFNQSLLKMLGTLDNSQKADWKSFIAPLLQAYNATKNDATGFSPHFLMFGWHPRLSVDAYLGIDTLERDETTAGPQSYGKKLKSRMEYAYDVAATHARKIGAKNKTIFDRGKREARLEVGDRVLVRNVGLKGKQKLADRWTEEVYVVSSVPNPQMPVYRVKQENGTKIRTLHRNMLLPFNSLPIEEPITEPVDEPVRVRDSRPAKKADRQESESSSSEESSDPGVYVIPHRRSKRRRRRVVQNPSLREQSHETSHDLSVSTPSSTQHSTRDSNPRQSATESGSRSSAQSRSSVSDWRSNLEPQESISRSNLHRDTAVSSRSGGSNIRQPESPGARPEPQPPEPQPSGEASRSGGSYLRLPDSPRDPPVPSQSTSMASGSNLGLPDSPRDPPEPKLPEQKTGEPEPPPSGRPQRRRKPPDRYGEWDE